jgi:hypothetical protein
MSCLNHEHDLPWQLFQTFAGSQPLAAPSSELEDQAALKEEEMLTLLDPAFRVLLAAFACQLCHMISLWESWV